MRNFDEVQMKKKKIIKRTLRIISSTLIVLFVLSVASIFCNHPNDLVERTVRSFYNEKENTLDYVVLGSSAAQCDVFPAAIWKENQMTGNNMCIDGCVSKIYLSLLKEILSTQKDAVILVDMDGFNYRVEDKGYNFKTFWIDTMRHNDNWHETINQLDSENRLEHYIPILKYHKNFLISYRNIAISKEKIFNHSSDSMKGANFLNKNRLPDEDMNSLVMLKNFNAVPKAVSKERESLLYEFLDFCRKNNIDNIVFCDFPKAYCNEEKYNDLLAYEEYGAYNEKIIREYGYDIINFNNLNNPCGLEVADFADSFHLKYTGAEKISKYLANYLENHFEVREKSDALINEWNQSSDEAYEKYGL